jgi:hypothetical protein
MGIIRSNRISNQGLIGSILMKEEDASWMERADGREEKVDGVDGSIKLGGNGKNRSETTAVILKIVEVCSIFIRFGIAFLL